ncbi:MAG: hypothetical protein KAS32_31185 [Candidatus Peribacteraceae bacterium]|nr:hypothetical protein [Candidatus Peribacteraceae bacterium]
MSNEDQNVRDIWGKIDVIGKVISGVLLAVITILIGIGVNRVEKAVKKGELVQSLISDLTQNEKRFRQDVALIALDHTLGDNDSDIVVEIAWQILVNRPQIPDNAAFDIAFQIIQKRNPKKAKKFEELQNNKVKIIKTGFYHDEYNENGKWKIFNPKTHGKMRFWVGAYISPNLGEVFIQGLRIKNKEFNSFFVGENPQYYVMGYNLQKFGMSYERQNRRGKWISVPIEEWDMTWATKVFSSPVELELIGTAGTKIAESKLPKLDFIN